MAEYIEEAFQELHSSINRLQSAIQCRFRDYDDNLNSLNDKVAELDNTKGKHERILHTIANAITEGMKE